MDIIEVSQNKQLRSIKSILWIGIVGSLISFVGLFIPLINLAANITICVFGIIFLIGIYQFSVFCRTFVFRFSLYGIGAILIFACLVYALLYFFGGLHLLKNNGRQLIILSSVIIACAVALIMFLVYLSYKISAEMRFLTHQNEFMLSFKMFIAVFFIHLIVTGSWIFLLNSFISHHPMIPLQLATLGIESVIMDFINEYTLQCIILAIIQGICVILHIIAYAFIALGIKRIQSVQVRQPQPSTIY